MARYISQRQAHDERAKLRAARRKLKIAMVALSDIGGGYCCESCAPGEPRCPVGQANEAIQLIKEVDG